MLIIGSMNELSKNDVCDMKMNSFYRIWGGARLRNGGYFTHIPM